MANQIKGPQGYDLDNNDIIDTSKLTDADLGTDVLKQFFLTIVQVFNRVRLAINGKTTGQYLLEENVPGNKFFPNPAIGSSFSLPNTLRPTTRKTFLIGALANAGTITVAHGITFGATGAIVLYGGFANKLTAPRSRIPLPFIDVAGVTGTGNIEIRTDDTNIYITTAGNGTLYTDNYVFIEYIQG